MSSNVLRLFNFVYFAMLAMFISFLPVYLDGEGISAKQIGLIIGTGGLVSVFSQPFWGVVSDKRKTVKLIILFILGMATVTGFFLYRTDEVWLLLGLTMVMYFFLLPIDPLTESLNFRIAEENKVSYGSIRTFGAFGYAVMSLIVGIVVAKFGSPSLAWLFVGLGVLGLLLTLMLPDAPSTSKPVTLSALKTFFSNRKTLGFLLLIFITAVPNRMNDQFLGIYLRELGGTVDGVGLAWFLSAGGEIIVFALSYWWLRKGHEIGLILFASIFYVLRFVLSAWVKDPQILIYLQLLQALSFPVFYSAAIQYLYRIVPEEWRATGQTVLAILFFGVSGIASSYLGGWYYDSFGGESMYLLMAGLSAVGLGFSLFLRQMYEKAWKS
ncbi:MFS transporter [Paenibacillus swuensis]|uniref:MFS transporter n=1 Tax=Paenibacillus swuensis TaxID=1178515 RepID=A0A172TIL1_9BACL|nr:MFS transporter [Paenibacillus swuensis]ANE46878.1 MFS transporter [Paenibacillus swuensis]